MFLIININGLWVFEFIWFIVVKLYDIYRESFLILFLKYKLNVCIKEFIVLKDRRE